MTWVLLQAIQLFTPTVSLTWEPQENTQVPRMEEEASWKWQFWEQVRECTASSALSAKMLKPAGRKQWKTHHPSSVLETRAIH